ncbi:unnamed protein product [Lupinus luteus]|uniref:FRIGIDA-like protein n=1 Tax=Lupinus luteus TaxID=3873 RepID=A0AAV1Y178_LUPLU
MATTSTVLNARVIAEPQDITNYFSPPPQFPPENDCADLTKSVNDLAKFAAATQAFKDRYDELQKHLDFIKQAIDEKTNGLTASPPVSATAGNSIGDSVQQAIGNGVSVQQAVGNGVAIQTALDSATITKSENVKEIEIEKVGENEIVTLCKKMSSRGLRKYILNHLSDADVALREQLCEALKIAPKPAKLVYESIGKFFLQGSKAYNINSPIIALRQAAVLVLECYLVSGCVVSQKEMDGYLRSEADSAAVQWRRRLIVEGGVANAVEIDARGLLFFIAGFGIPSLFTNEDVLNLVRLSNPGEISQALRQSQVLLKRVSVMAEGLVKRGMAVEVVDLAYTFGFQEKYSIHMMLNSFLQKSEEAWKKAKATQESYNFSNVLKEANEKYMNDLKSVVNCLEGHKIDFEKLLPGWKLKDKIINMEKDISDINKKIQEKVVPKRKVDKSDSPKKVMIQEAKGSRFPEKDSYVALPSVTALPEQRIASHIDGNNSDDDLLVARYLDGRSYGYSNYYPTASSAPIGSVSGSVPESYLGGTVSGVGNMHAGGISAPTIRAGTNYYPTASSAPIGSISGSLPESFLGGTVSGVGNMHRGGISAHAMPAGTNYYPTASSAPIGSVSGSLPESYLGGTVSGVGSMHGGGISAPAMPAGTNYYPTASSAPIGSVSGSLPESYLGGTVSGVGNMHRGGISAPAMPAGTDYYPTASSAPIGSVSGSLPESYLGGTVSGVGNMHRGGISAPAMPAGTDYYPTASSAPIGSVSGSLPESYLGGTIPGVRNMHGGGTAVPAIPAGIGAPSSSYSGHQRDTTMDNVETMMNSNSHLYHRWHGTGTGTGAGPLSDERLVGQSFGEHHSVDRVNDLYGRTTTDRYSGYLDHPSVGVTGRGGGSDLYSFADSVFDR